MVFKMSRVNFREFTERRSSLSLLKRASKSLFLYG